MLSQSENTRNSKGVPSVESRDNRLRIRVRINGERKAIALGLTDTPENMLKAEAIARQMQLDILSNNFDISFNKYRPQAHLTVVETFKPKAKVKITALWEKYTEFRAKQVEVTTLAKNYDRVANHLKRLPTADLDNAVDIRDYFLANTSPYTAKRLLTQLNACCNWAVRSKLITVSPFDGMAQEIKVTKNSTDELDIDPFSRQERETVIQAFENHVKYKCYAPFVRFLFLTGCRTSEAIGLKWKHINADCSKITFCEAVVSVPSGKVRKGLKNQDKRIFPCNKQLQSFLLSLKSGIKDDDSPTFTSMQGKEINIYTFYAVWHGGKHYDKQYVGVVEQLARDGKIDHYRPQYQTRHTFITLCIDAGIDAKDVARWVGNSPEVIYRHYAGNKRDLQVPEI